MVLIKLWVAYFSGGGGAWPFQNLRTQVSPHFIHVGPGMAGHSSRLSLVLVWNDRVSHLVKPRVMSYPWSYLGHGDEEVSRGL